MACYHPMRAFHRPATKDSAGSVVLHPPTGTANILLPCGQCLGCKTARASDWARRCVHEASLWDFNCFVTLTYSDDFIPFAGSLDGDALTKFIKRLRSQSGRHSIILRNPDFPIRYFAVGEYGGQFGRPHYHLLLFNCSFGDAKVYSSDLFTSELLERLWPFGSCKIGQVTGASAAYVAQYTFDKVEAPEPHLEPAFLRMSKKPALGWPWLLKYGNDLINGYLVTSEGTKVSIPRSYMSCMKVHNPELYEYVEFNRIERMLTLSGQRDSTNPISMEGRRRLDSAELIHKRRKQLMARHVG